MENVGAMTLDRLAEMVQEGFLDMGDRFDRVEGRISNVEADVGQLKEDIGQLKEDMVEVKSELPKYATASMHSQLNRRVVVIEEHLGL